MKRRRFGTLDVVVGGGSDGDGGGEGPLLVLLHGFGAPGTDLVPLVDALSANMKWRFAFPAAPIDLAPHLAAMGGLAAMDARAWWLIDIADYQQALAEGRLEELAAANPEGFAEALHELDGCLQALTKAFLTNGQPWLLGGFSQGGMLAAQYGARGTVRPDGLIIMSGGLIDSTRFAPALSNVSPIPVFQSHGRQDPIVPFALGQRLKQELEHHACRVQFASFEGGHEIPAATLAAMGAFLNTWDGATHM